MVAPSFRFGSRVPAQVVELAALLYIGEYVHARHVWRRWSSSHNPPALLADWWTVGAAMMASGGGDGDAAASADAVWRGLEHIRTTHPSPLSRYAEEVGTAHRVRLLRLLQSSPSSPPHPPPRRMMGFASDAELEDFCRRQHGIGPGGTKTIGGAAGTPGLTTSGMVDGKASLVQVVSFLECTSRAGRA